MEYKKTFNKGDELGPELDKFILGCLMKVCTVKQNLHPDLTTVRFNKTVELKIILTHPNN